MMHHAGVRSHYIALAVRTLITAGVAVFIALQVYHAAAQLAVRLFAVRP